MRVFVYGISSAISGPVDSKTKVELSVEYAIEQLIVEGTPCFQFWVIKIKNMLSVKIIVIINDFRRLKMCYF